MHTMNSRLVVQRAIQLLGIVGKLAIGVLILGVVVKSNVPSANAGASLAPEAASAVILPSQIIVPPNGIGVASVVIQNDATPNGLGAAEFEMTYDKTVVNALNAYDSGFLFTTGRTNPGTVGITIPLKSLDNIAGLAAVGLFSLSTNPAQGTPNGPNGTGTLAKVSLKGVGAAGTSSALTLQNVLTTDALANATNVTPGPGGLLKISNQPFLVLPGLVKAFAPSGVANDQLSSAVQIQNLDGSNPLNATLTYFTSPGGDPFASTTVSTTAGNRVGVDQRNDVNLGGSFAGSGVVGADRSAAALVNIQSTGTTATLGKDFRFASFTTLPGTGDAGTALVLPQVLKNITDAAVGKTYTSLIILQNTTDTTANVTITYNNKLASPLVANYTVPPWGPTYIWLGDVGGGGTPLIFGSANISSNRAIVALVEQHAPGLLSAYKGFVSGATSLKAPQILKSVFVADENYSYGTAVQFQAIGASSTVTITCTGINTTNGSPVNFSRTKTGTPDESFDQRTDGGIPNGFFGSCDLTATSPIVAIVNLQTNTDATRGTRLATYPALGSANGSTTLFAPQLLKNANDSTGVTYSSAMNVVGTASGSVNISVHYVGIRLDNGNPVDLTVPQTCNPQCDVNQRTLAVPSFFGSATITSASSIVGNVNFAGTNANPGDGYDNYTLIKQ
ncbi:MAG: hypothetical protein EXR62_07820 [Chloroflexi bacterium]|nr:hypothetical protein [Chloroflexota bacterium]